MRWAAAVLVVAHLWAAPAAFAEGPQLLLAGASDCGEGHCAPTTTRNEPAEPEDSNAFPWEAWSKVVKEESLNLKRDLDSKTDQFAETLGLVDPNKASANSATNDLYVGYVRDQRNDAFKAATASYVKTLYDLYDALGEKVSTQYENETPAVQQDVFGFLRTATRQHWQRVAEPLLVAHLASIFGKAAELEEALKNAPRESP